VHYQDIAQLRSRTYIQLLSHFISVIIVVVISGTCPMVAGQQTKAQVTAKQDELDALI